MHREADGKERGGSGGRGRLIGPAAVILALALAAFAISLLATLPARVAATYVAMPVQFNAYSGTIWNGAASMAGGHSLAWRVDPWRSLIAFRPQAEASLTGPGTDLEGHLAFGGSAGNGLGISGLSGRLAWPAIAALAPDLPFVCEMDATLSGVTAGSAGGAEGLVTAGPGSCTAAGGGEPVAVPELAGRLEPGQDGVRLVVAAADRPEAPLAELGMGSAGVILVRITPDGAALLPGAAGMGGATISFPLRR